MMKRLISIQSRAKARGIEFSITRSQALKLSNTRVCPVTGRTLKIGATKVGGAPDPDALSIDRKNPRKGYTFRNVQVMSNWANTSKNALSEKQFKLLLMAAASNMRH